MSRVQNSFLAVVELAEKQHQARDPKADVRRRDHDFRPFARRRETKLVHEYLWFFQVLDDVEHEDLIELGYVHGKFLSVQIPFDVVNSPRSERAVRNVLIHAGNTTAFRRQFPRDITLAASDIENVALGTCGLDRRGVRRRKAEFEIVILFRRMDREFAIEKEIHLVESHAEHRSKNVPGVLQPVYVANLIAVISWNRQFDDAEV